MFFQWLTATRTCNFCPSCEAKRSALFAEHDVTPDLVVSIRTFGSYAANFHPHVHALVTGGAFTEGEFLRLPYFDARLNLPPPRAPALAPRRAALGGVP